MTFPGMPNGVELAEEYLFLVKNYWKSLRMAARTNKRLHEEQTKRRIQASQLLNRLECYAKGEIEMTQGQVLAAKIVIGKSIPDLKAIEHSGNDERPVQRRMIVEFVAPKRSESET